MGSVTFANLLICLAVGHQLQGVTTKSQQSKCGGGGCHVGALPHGFVGDLATSQDVTYSTGILVDLSNGTMPKGRAITPADQAIITNYLCARLNI